MQTQTLVLTLSNAELAALMLAVQAARANATGREENTLACVEDSIEKAARPDVRVVSGIFSGEAGKLNKVVSSHPSGEPLSQAFYFVELKDGEVAFYKHELEFPKK